MVFSFPSSPMNSPCNVRLSFLFLDLFSGGSSALIFLRNSCPQCCPSVLIRPGPPGLRVIFPLYCNTRQCVVFPSPHEHEGVQHFPSGLWFVGTQSSDFLLFDFTLFFFFLDFLRSFSLLRPQQAKPFFILASCITFDPFPLSSCMTIFFLCFFFNL